MSTETKENYLKVIYFLHQRKADISLTELSKEMKVSTSTANSMVKKLHLKGWVEYNKYKPLNLTPKGKRDAALIIRKHRLTEMFLSKIMGFGWEEVHDIAEQIEHIDSEKFFDRMNKMLESPSTDPHGSPIPGKSGTTVVKKNLFKLSDVKKGQKVQLCALEKSSNELLLFLNKKKIALGQEMVIVDVETFDKSLRIQIENNKIMILSHKVCEHLLVEKK